jgi:hypothetical protein
MPRIYNFTGSKLAGARDDLPRQGPRRDARPMSKQQGQTILYKLGHHW